MMPALSICISLPVPDFTQIAEQLGEQYQAIVADVRSQITNAKNLIIQKEQQLEAKIHELSTETYQSIKNQIQGFKDQISAIKSLITGLTVPGIIGLADPIFDDIRNISMELAQIAQYLQTMSLTSTLMAMIKPMVGVIGGMLESLLPKIPILGINVLDLLAMSPADLKAIIKAKYQESRDALMAAFSAFLPIPLYPGFDIPSFEINAIIKAIYSYCINGLITLCTSLINQVINKLKLSATLILSILPTLSDLQAMLKQMAGQLVGKLADEFADELDAINAVLQQGISINQLLAMINFPGLGSFHLPDPLFAGLSSTAIELAEAIQIYMANLMAAIIQQLADFVQSVLSMLGITFPEICISIPIGIPVISIPDFAI